ncbi:MAG: hypothetical protein RL341_348, partial [Pseudomonadota bacterium]
MARHADAPLRVSARSGLHAANAGVCGAKTSMSV